MPPTWPLAASASVLLVRFSGRAALPGEARTEQMLAGLTVYFAWTIVGVRLLAGAGILGGVTVLAWLCVGAALAWARARHVPAPAPEPWVTAVTLPVALVASAAALLLLACVALLPPWHWDGLGYHLPLVSYLLERGRFDDVPPDIPFLSTYPRNVEYFYAAFRSQLRDDTWIDGAQLPFVPLAVFAAASLGKSVGARADQGVAAGLVFCMLPAALLILPTDYIDFACAALLLAAMAWTLRPPARAHLALAALALGLFLGAKSNGPVGTLLVGAVGAARYGRRRAWPLVAAAVLVLALGAEMYVVNTVRHHNPLWPIDLWAGPVHLRGTVTVEKLLAAGARAPRVWGPLPVRIIESWTALRTPPVFDMRFGGLGLVFDAALLGAVWLAWKKRADRRLLLALAAFALAAVASPDPAWPRYVLALPALALGVAAAAVSRGERPLWWGIAALSSANVIYAAPGLTGDGPKLSAYLTMSAEERARAVWAESPVDGWFAARDALKPGENAAYDYSMELPYLLWKPDLGNRVFRLPDHASTLEVEDLLRTHDVHLLVAGDDEPAGAVVRAHPERFQLLFRCPLRSCAVFRL